MLHKWKATDELYKNDISYLFSKLRTLKRHYELIVSALDLQERTNPGLVNWNLQQTLLELSSQQWTSSTASCRFMLQIKDYYKPIFVLIFGKGKYVVAPTIK